MAGACHQRINAPVPEVVGDAACGAHGQPAQHDPAHQRWRRRGQGLEPQGPAGGDQQDQAPTRLVPAHQLERGPQAGAERAGSLGPGFRHQLRINRCRLGASLEAATFSGLGHRESRRLLPLCTFRLRACESAQPWRHQVPLRSQGPWRQSQQPLGVARCAVASCCGTSPSPAGRSGGAASANTVAQRAGCAESWLPR